MSETALQKSIKSGLEQAGFWVIRVGVNVKRGGHGSASGEPGMPDLLLVGLGYQEVKLPGEKLRPVQVEWHRKAEERGVKVATVSSVGEAVRVAQEWERDLLRLAGVVAMKGRE